MIKFVKNTSLYTIGNIIPQATGFILLPIYTRYLSPEEYGIVNSMVALVAIFSVFFSLALERSIFRLYFDYTSEKDKQDFLSTISISIVIISTLILILLFVFHSYIGLIYKSIDFYPYYSLAILSIYFSTFSLVPKAYYQVTEQAGKFIVISILTFLLTTGLVLWYVVGLNCGAEGMLKGRMFGSVVLIPLFLFILYKHTNLSLRLFYLKECLSFSLPMVPTLVVAWILNLSDRVFIERYFTLADVGIYSLGYKIAGIGLIVTSALSMAYSPVFFRLANDANQVASKIKIMNFNHRYLNLVLFIFFIPAFFAKEILLLLDARYLNAYKLIPIISLAYVVVTFQSLVGLYNKQSKKTLQIMYIAFLMATVNVGLNFSLIPVFGAYGAAYATVLSFAVGYFVSYNFAKKYCYFIPFQWSQIIPIAGILIAIVIIFQYVLVLDVVVSLIVKLIIVGIGGLFFMRKYYSQIRGMMAK